MMTVDPEVARLLTAWLDTWVEATAKAHQLVLGGWWSMLFSPTNSS